MRFSKFKHIAALLIISLVSFPTFGHSKQAYENERLLFLKIESELKQGRRNLYLQRKHELKHYPLISYLDYIDLSNRLYHIDYKEFQEFEKHYPNSPLTYQLRKHWLNIQAKKDAWRNFIKAYKPVQHTELQCHAIWAQLKTSNEPTIHETLLKYVKSIWLEGKSQPKACDKVFEYWASKGYQTRSIIWQRIKLAIEENNISLARYLRNKLKKSEQGLVDLWIKVHQNPYTIKRLQDFNRAHPAILEMLVYGITQVAKKKPNHAITYWQNISTKKSFKERHWGLVVKAIGLSLAKENHKNADKWLKKVPSRLVDYHVKNSRLRIALLNYDWDTILKLTKDLTQETHNYEKWAYWKARALEMKGKRKDSQSILRNLASTRSYYGFLSSLRLLQPYSFQHEIVNIKSKHIKNIARHPEIERAIELQYLERHHQANLEWQYAISNMSEEQKQAAAKLAHQLKTPNWSIIALSKASNKNDLNLRFPLNYVHLISQEAKHNDIDAAWIFAITRQESAFIPTAKSPAGALGLMQLIPSTAKMVARITKHKLPQLRILYQADTNIKLGSKYLRMMLDKNQNNPVLATAAYNAGAARVQQWLPEYDMPADSWIETIPFKETRNYVQNVLAYTVIYQELLGKKPKLKPYMPIIIGSQPKLIAKKS